MKRPIALLFCLLMITMPMAGCLGGDDSSDAPDEELSDWNVHFAATAADLPICNEDTNGRLYYVEADNQFQVCKTTGWEVIAIQGADGQDGATGTDGADGQDGTQGSAGTDGQDGDDGSDGASILITTSSSTSCSSGGNTFNIGPDSNSNGFLEASEVVMNVDICNGAQGPAGPPGADGQDGAPGADGQDGAPGADGQDGATGADGQDGATGADGQDGATGADGQDGAQGTQGPAGNDGADGNTTLTVATTLSAGGSNCWGDGGVQIDVGIDDNKNGVLDSNEIDDTTYICNGGDGVDGDSAYQIWLNNGNTGSEQDYLDSLEGTSGTDGADGTDGNDGADGNNVLIETSTEPAGNNCANGGVKIMAGTDDNSNGVLQSSEVDSTQYICDGGSSATTMLTSYSTPPTYMNCDIGGSVIAHGLDNGDGSGTAANGQLESGEVDYSTTFCTKSTMLRIDINPGSGGSTPESLTVFNNELYFSAYDATNGNELWKYDGTNAPSMVANINPGSGNSYPESLTVFNNELYFRADDGTNGVELWKYTQQTTITYA